METVWLTLRGVSPSIWSFCIERRRQVIGRKSSCEIQLLHKSVSRQHAEVRQDDDGNVYIQDLESSNGTYVNGTRVKDAPLAIGDIVQLGQVMLDVSLDPETDPEPEVLLNRTTELGQELQAVETIDMTMESLTEAQLRVLRLLLTGQSEKEIAEVLFLSPHTVHSHVKQIYQYYDVNSRPALMAHFIDIAALGGDQST